MNNKKLGNSFEHDFCLLAAKNGFWAHRLQDNKNGQPADVIMAMNNISIIVDCKVCENSTFPLSRMEENQINAMTLWNMRGNKHTYFALKIDNEVRMIKFSKLMELKRLGIKQLNEHDIYSYSLGFNGWKEWFFEQN